jgi:general stress protein CsbA
LLLKSLLIRYHHQVLLLLVVLLLKSLLTRYHHQVVLVLMMILSLT